MSIQQNDGSVQPGPVTFTAKGLAPGVQYHVFCPVEEALNSIRKWHINPL